LFGIDDGEVDIPEEHGPEEFVEDYDDDAEFLVHYPRQEDMHVYYDFLYKLINIIKLLN